MSSRCPKWPKMPPNAVEPLQRGAAAPRYTNLEKTAKKEPVHTNTQKKGLANDSLLRQTVIGCVQFHCPGSSAVSWSWVGHPCSLSMGIPCQKQQNMSQRLASTVVVKSNDEETCING